MKFIRVIKAKVIKPNIDDYNFTDYRNPDAFFYGQMPERGTYKKALKSVVDEIEHKFNVVKKKYWGNTPAAKQFEIDLNNIWSHSTVKDTLSTTDSAVRLTHLPTGIIVYSQTERSQIKNKEKALTILKLLPVVRGERFSQMTHQYCRKH